MKTYLLGGAAALLLATGSAFAASSWDANGDGMIDADEYGVSMQESQTFAMYDADGDGMISQDEFNATTWKVYDADGDGMWNETEASAWRDSSLRAGAEVSQ